MDKNTIEAGFESEAAILAVTERRVRLYQALKSTDPNRILRAVESLVSDWVVRNDVTQLAALAGFIAGCNDVGNPQCYACGSFREDGLCPNCDYDALTPAQLSEREVDELLVNVSISKLERLLRDRRAELADTPAEVGETIAETCARLADYSCSTCDGPLNAAGHCPECDSRYWCTVCKVNPVDAEAWFDTCESCARSI